MFNYNYIMYDSEIEAFTIRYLSAVILFGSVDVSKTSLHIIIYK